MDKITAILKEEEHYTFSNKVKEEGIDYEILCDIKSRGWTAQMEYTTELLYEIIKLQSERNKLLTFIRE